MTTPLDDFWASLTIRDYVCSNCWGHLDKMPAPEERAWFVYCPNCGIENTTGYVTKYFAERRRADSAGDLADTRHMLQKIGVIKNPHAGKTVKQLLEELGF